MDLYGARNGLHPGQKPGQENGLPGSMKRLNAWERELYPERPGQADCTYYMRTGSCAFGAKCRYNHPRNVDSLIHQVRGPIQSGDEQYPERAGEPTCQYYIRTGTCKFGPTCKFNHPKDAAGSLINAPLNVHGYPLRPGEKECSYYLQKGQCKFGIACKFHHPQPADRSIVSSTARPFYLSLQPLLSPSPQQYHNTLTSYRITRPALLSGSYMASGYGPMLLPQGLVSVPNWNPYSGQVSAALSPDTEHSARPANIYGVLQLASSMPGFASTYPKELSSSSDHSSGEKRFPKRPDQPDCKYYMRTGDCKYGSSCRYNHPPDWSVANMDFAVSPLGLPLRPGVVACSYYMLKGYCKFGMACKFDHPVPVGTAKYSPALSYVEMPG